MALERAYDVTADLFARESREFGAGGDVALYLNTRIRAHISIAYLCAQFDNCMIFDNIVAFAAP